MKEGGVFKKYLFAEVLKDNEHVRSSDVAFAHGAMDRRIHPSW